MYIPKVYTQYICVCVYRDMTAPFPKFLDDTMAESKLSYTAWKWILFLVAEANQTNLYTVYKTSSNKRHTRNHSIQSTRE